MIEYQDEFPELSDLAPEVLVRDMNCIPNSYSNSLDIVMICRQCLAGRKVIVGSDVRSGRTPTFIRTTLTLSTAR